MVDDILVRRNGAPDCLLFRGEAGQRVQQLHAVLFVLLLYAIDQLRHVPDQLLVVLAILAELLEHLVSGDHLLDEVSVDVRDQNQLVRCQMRQKLFRDVARLGDPTTVLEELNEDEELVWSLQDDAQIE